MRLRRSRLGAWRRRGGPAVERLPLLAEPADRYDTPRGCGLHVLYVCRGNSTLSIMAEAMTRVMGGGQVRAWSAGSHPAGAVHAMTLDVLERVHVPRDGLSCKSWPQLRQAGVPALDLVIVLDESAFDGRLPCWPGSPWTVRWHFADPARAPAGTPGVRDFHDVGAMLRRRIGLMLALPAEALGHQIERRRDRATAAAEAWTQPDAVPCELAASPAAPAGGAAGGAG